MKNHKILSIMLMILCVLGAFMGMGITVTVAVQNGMTEQFAGIVACFVALLFFILAEIIGMRAKLFPKWLCQIIKISWCSGLIALFGLSIYFLLNGWNIP